MLFSATRAHTLYPSYLGRTWADAINLPASAGPTSATKQTPTETKYRPPPPSNQLHIHCGPQDKFNMLCLSSCMSLAFLSGPDHSVFYPTEHQHQFVVHLFYLVFSHHKLDYCIGNLAVTHYTCNFNSISWSTKQHKKTCQACNFELAGQNTT